MGRLPVQIPSSHLHCAFGLATQELAGVLDSLVRVSRRVKKTNESTSHACLNP